MVALANVLVRPIVSEKSVSGEAKGKYTFEIQGTATKADVKKALKAFYGLEASSVNIVNLKSKRRLAGRRGLYLTRRAPTKKAIVSVKGGEKLDFNAFK